MKRILLMFALICVLDIVSAIPIEIYPSSLDVNITKGVNKVISLNITNLNTYTLYDVRAEGSIVIASSILPVFKENDILDVTIKVDEKGDFTKTLTIIGFTKVNCTELESVTHEINITSGGCHPRNLDVCKDDNIKYYNNYGSSVYLDIDSLSVYEGIGNGNSYVQNFPNSGLTVYRIEPLIDMGYIDVKSGSSSVHNKENDGEIILNIHSVLEETFIDYFFPKTHFNVSFDSIETGYFTVENIGFKTAENVRFIADWFSFDKNNFDLEPGEEKAINFVISPLIVETDETEKEHTKTIYINGDNLMTVTQNISIYVPYYDVASGNISSPEWWVKRKEFCTSFPTAPDCLTEPYIIYKDKVIYDAPPILANMSPADIQEYVREVLGLREDWLTYSNNFKTELDIVKTGVIEAKILANQSMDKMNSYESNFNSFKVVFNILFGSFILIVIGFGAGYCLYHYYLKKKAIQEGMI